jgi:membrane protein
MVHTMAGRKLGWSEYVELAGSAYDGWFRDNIPRLGAALAFYTLLSLAPMLIVVIAIASLAYGPQAAEGRLVWEIQGLVGEQGASFIQSLLKSTRAPASGIAATALGLCVLCFGATAVFSELKEDLDTIWQVESGTRSNWRSFLALARGRLFSFAIVVSVGFLLLVSLVANAWLSAAGRFFGNVLPTPEWILQLIYAIISFAGVALLFAALYKVLPDVALEWGDVALGATIASLLFSAGKVLIGLYLGKASFANSYGAAGSLVILIVWVYYSAQIFFLGVEFARAYTERHGSRSRRS